MVEVFQYHYLCMNILLNLPQILSRDTSSLQSIVIKHSKVGNYHLLQGKEVNRSFTVHGELVEET